MLWLNILITLFYSIDENMQNNSYYPISLKTNIYNHMNNNNIIEFEKWEHKY